MWLQCSSRKVLSVKALKPLSCFSFFFHTRFITFYLQALEEGAVANLIAMSLEVCSYVLYSVWPKTQFD